MRKLVFPSTFILVLHRNIILKVTFFPLCFLPCSSTFITQICIVNIYWIGYNIQGTELDALGEYKNEFRQGFCPQRTQSLTEKTYSLWYLIFPIFLQSNRFSFRDWTWTLSMSNPVLFTAVFRANNHHGFRKTLPLWVLKIQCPGKPLHPKQTGRTGHPWCFLQWVLNFFPAFLDVLNKFRKYLHSVMKWKTFRALV